VIVLSVVLLALWLRYRGDPNYRLKQFDGFFRGVIYCLALYALNLAPYLAVKRRWVGTQAVQWRGTTR
jgi:hypothetical protein